MDALTMTKYADDILGEYLRANIGKKIKTVVFKNYAARAIDRKIKNRLAVKCRRVILNEVWISIKGKGNKLKKLIQDAEPIRSNCVEFIIDAPGKFRR
jgi:ribonuclease I